VSDLLEQYLPPRLSTSLAVAFSSAAASAGTTTDPPAALITGLTGRPQPRWVANVAVPGELVAVYPALTSQVASLRPSLETLLPSPLGQPLASVGSTGGALSLPAETQSFGFTTGTLTTTDGSGATTTKVFTSKVNTLATAATTSGGGGGGGSGPSSTRAPNGSAARPTGVREMVGGLVAVIGMVAAL